MVGGRFVENREYSPQNKLAGFIGKDGKFKLFEASTMLSLFWGVREPFFGLSSYGNLYNRFLAWKRNLIWAR